MARYLKVTATAVIKIQDPYDDKIIEKAKDTIALSSSHELLDEEYTFEEEESQKEVPKDSVQTVEDALDILLDELQEATKGGEINKKVAIRILSDTLKYIKSL